MSGGVGGGGLTEPLRAGDPSRVGRYRLLGRLGAGGMGVVYLGRSLGGGLVALKVIQGEFAQDDGFRARFRREVAAARRVDSPWAVPVTDAETEIDIEAESGTGAGTVSLTKLPAAANRGTEPEPTQLWLATPFVPGPSLHEAVAGHGALPVRSVRTLGGRLAEALASVHSADLVHRDVKPANVLLALDGPRLIDFGIARSLDDTAITSTDVVVGSPGFLSPEQARAEGAAIGPPSDVFSLGCVLAYAATGRAPFGTGAVDVMLFRTVHDPADLAGVPEDLLPVLEACLDKAPEARPTASALARELIEDTAPGDPGGWLPAPVTYLIAARSAAVLDLPGDGSGDGGGGLEGPEESGRTQTVEGGVGAVARVGGVPVAAAAAPAAPVPPAPAEGPTRRRFLAFASGGAVLALGGGAAAWAALARGGGASGDRYTIGVHADLSGAGRAAGKAQENGVRLAVERLNAREDRPFELSVKVLDDGGDPDRAVTVAKEMTADRAVLAVVGPTTDRTLMPVLEVYDNRSTPLLSVSTQTMYGSGQGIDSHLHARPNALTQAWPIGVYGQNTPGITRTGVIIDRTTDVYGQQVARAVIGSLGERQETVPRVVPAGTEDFGPVVGELLAEGVDSVVFGGSYASAARVARELRDAGFTGPCFATELAVDPRFLKAAGGAAEGWMLTSTAIDPAAKPEAARFTAAYDKAYDGAAPGMYAAEAYDVVGMVADALREGGKGGRDRKALLGRLHDTGYQGITKKFAFMDGTGVFDATEDNTGTFFYRVEDGRFRFLGEASYTVDVEGP